eukprot:m.383250 g.383250  ORF g.383250 m.383250 type:complete len:284 (-) comp123705_c0_seq1:88-939(-)
MDNLSDMYVPGLTETVAWLDTIQFKTELGEALVQPAVLIGTGVGYWITMHLLWRAFKGKCFFPRNIARIYNIIQIVICSYMTYRMTQVIMASGPPVVISIGTEGSVSFPNFLSINHEFTDEAERLIYIHYLSKFLDFADTIFIVMRQSKRQFSWLHLYHHATIGPIWGMLLLLGFGNGAGIFGAWINSLTHVIMYTHYLVSSFISHPFKPLITAWQLFQFLMCVLHAFLGWAFDKYFPTWLCGVQIAYHMSMITLFGHFFMTSYGSKGKKEDAKKIKGDKKSK